MLQTESVGLAVVEIELLVHQSEKAIVPKRFKLARLLRKEERLDTPLVRDADLGAARTPVSVDHGASLLFNIARCFKSNEVEDPKCTRPGSTTSPVSQVSRQRLSDASSGGMEACLQGCSRCCIVMLCEVDRHARCFFDRTSPLANSGGKGSFAIRVCSRYLIEQVKTERPPWSPASHLTTQRCWV